MSTSAAPPLVLHFADQSMQARAFAKAAGLASAALEARRFPDGESLLRLPLPLPPRVLLFCSLARPNERLVELLLAARTARRHGVRQLGLLAPYLCYMRQDSEFNPGEAVSQTVVGEFLAGLFDAVVTVDPHLHRIETLAQAVPAAKAVAVSAAAAVARFLGTAGPDAVLVGPDAESSQWVADIAARAGLAFTVCTKRRFGDRDVRVALPDEPDGARLAGTALATRPVVLIDDIASSGQTLVKAAVACRAAGAASIDAFVTHALCGDAEMATLRDAGIRRLWSTDTVAHPSNAVTVAALMAAACRHHGLA